MARKAKRVYSLEGFFRDIHAKEIRSRQHAKKVGPFVDDGFHLLFWVSPSYDPITRKLRRSSYFSHYASQSTLKEVVGQIGTKKAPDRRHKIIQQRMWEAIGSAIGNREKIEWFYRDEELSDYVLSGNLLENALEIEKEYRYEIPALKITYQFDLAILGRKVGRDKVVLAAIELENTHEMDVQKTLLCKSIGFPLFSVDISEIPEEEITSELCLELLKETRLTGKDSRRRNFIFLHNLLFPIYLPELAEAEYARGHQYVIFLRSLEVRDELGALLTKLLEALSLRTSSVVLGIVNINHRDKGSLTMQVNDTSLIGQGIGDYDIDHYIRISTSKPIHDSVLWIFHMVLTKLLALRFDCLVGYKYQKTGLTNSRHDSRYWEKDIWEGGKKVRTSRICPKELSEPVFQILRLIDNAQA